MNNYQDHEAIGYELGSRVYRAMCAENCEPRYIAGVSDLFYLTDTSDDWSDIVALTRIDELSDFSLWQGVAMIGRDLMAKWGLSADEAIDELEIWEARGGTGWEEEDRARNEELWEEAVSSGRFDEELRYDLPCLW